MKLFTNKNIIQKIIIVLVIILLFNFAIPKQVNAGLGGILMDPVFQFVLASADAFQYLIQWTMTGDLNYFLQQPDSDLVKPGDVNSENLITIDSSDFDDPLMTQITKDSLKMIVLGPFSTMSKIIDGSAYYSVPVINYSPEEIFSNKVPALDINFLHPKVQGDDERNTAMVLRPVVSSWYVAIRTFALVGLLSVLIYLGIRILIASTGKEKAKYVGMIRDWLVAMCLLFVMHYIMSFTLTICETITSMISPTTGSSVTIQMTGKDASVFSTNLIGYARFMTQTPNLSDRIGFTFIYIMLIVYTYRFTWTYVKRVFIMAFLTVIAPFVALTYPIDKVGDGKAQAFSMWLKEYCFNALMQPMHMMLYLILVTSATSLAFNNPLYAVIALGFITQAEKFFRSMFGFSKASGGTVSPLATMAGAAMLNKVLSKAGSKGGNGGNGKIKTKEHPERSGADLDANKDGKGYIGNAGNVEDSYLEEARRQLNPGSETPQGGGGAPVSEEVARQQQEWQRENNENTVDFASGSGEEGSTSPIRTNDGGQGLEDSTTTTLGGAQGAVTSRGPQGAATSGGPQVATPSPMPQRRIDKPKGMNKGQKFIGNAKKVARVVGRAAYSGGKNAIKLGAGVAAGSLLGVAALAGTGDLSQALSVAGTAGGMAAGGLGKGIGAIEKRAGIDGTVRSTYNSVRGKTSIQKANEKADKQHFMSDEWKKHKQHYYGNRSAQEQAEIEQKYKEFRKTGETNDDRIRKAIKLEEKIKQSGRTPTQKELENMLQFDKKFDADVFSEGKDSKKYKAAVEKMESQFSDIEDDVTRKAVALKALDDLQSFRNL